MWESDATSGRLRDLPALEERCAGLPSNTIVVSFLSNLLLVVGVTKVIIKAPRNLTGRKIKRRGRHLHVGIKSEKVYQVPLISDFLIQLFKQ